MRKILLLHGALGCSGQFDNLSKALTNEGFTVYKLNFSGHGGQPFTKSFGIETFAAEVHDFLTENDLQNIPVFGYSMGGYVAMWLAHVCPSLIGRIVTLGTKFDWSPDSAAHEVKKLDPKKVEEKVPAFARLLESRHHPNDWKELMVKTSNMMVRLGNAPLLTRVTLNTITNRTLILLGDQDDMADRSFSNDVATIISHGRFQLLSDTPHPIEKVDIRKLTTILATFLED